MSNQLTDVGWEEVYVGMGEILSRGYRGTLLTLLSPFEMGKVKTRPVAAQVPVM